KRDPLITTTFGVGELIKACIDRGCEKIMIGIGGSATNDGGIGMAQALGVNFTDKNGYNIGYGGGNLEQVDAVHIPSGGVVPKDVDIIVACDVKNPLYGPSGATFIYGPQKGATPEMLEILEN